MKIERTKQTIQGSFWGILERIVRLVMPYLLRVIVLHVLGKEYLGLNSLFNSILKVLSLTELGFGLAVVYCMYKPIAEGDDDKVSAIVTYLKRIYRAIGLVIFGVGLLITPFVPKLVAGNIPDGINLYVLYLMYLINTSSSYFLFAYKSSLLSALQLNSTLSQVGFVCYIGCYTAQIIALYTTKNFYLYTILIPIFSITRNFIVSQIVNRRYPHLIRQLPIDDADRKQIRSKIFPLMSVKIGSVLAVSIDTIVISSLFGAVPAAIYNNYYYICHGIQNLLTVIYHSMQAGVGNSLVLDSKEKIRGDYEKFEIINNWMVTLATVMLLCLFQPFIAWSYGEDMLYPASSMIVFCLYFYLVTIEQIAVMYKDASGLWREDLPRSLGANVLNIVLSIVLAKKVGTIGVILASVIATGIGIPFVDYVVFRHCLEAPLLPQYGRRLLRGAISLITCGACSYDENVNIIITHDLFSPF